MFTLEKIDNEKAYKLYYKFVEEANPEWKKSYNLQCMLLKQTKIEQNDMSDYEYFLKTRTDLSNKYLLIWNNLPVCLVMISERNNITRDISFSTLPKYRKKGFATQAVMMVENKLFQSNDVHFTSIVDMKYEHISGKIANKLGYQYLKNMGFYLKANPNLNI